MGHEIFLRHQSLFIRQPDMERKSLFKRKTAKQRVITLPVRVIKNILSYLDVLSLLSALMIPILQKTILEDDSNKVKILDYLLEHNVLTTNFDFGEVVLRNINEVLEPGLIEIFAIIGNKIKWLDIQNCILSKNNLIAIQKVMPNLETLTVKTSYIFNSLEPDIKTPHLIKGFVTWLVNLNESSFNKNFIKYFKRLESSNITKRRTVENATHVQSSFQA